MDKEVYGGKHVDKNHERCALPASNNFNNVFSSLMPLDMLQNRRIRQVM